MPQLLSIKWSCGGEKAEIWDGERWLPLSIELRNIQREVDQLFAKNQAIIEELEKTV
jgi:hypothetical protein